MSVLNSTNNFTSLDVLTNDETNSLFFRFLAYFSLVIIALGLLGNSTCFLVFRIHKDFRNTSTMVYLSFVAITDTLSLFGWNLDHYLVPLHFTSLELTDKVLCRLSIFNQYASMQSSALVMSVMSVDRFVQIYHLPGSTLSKLPFRTVKSAYVWSIGVMCAVACLNSHILFMSCDLITWPVQLKGNTYREKFIYVQNLTNTAYAYTNGFNLYPTWEQVHLVVYVIIPFCIMIITNSLIIRKIIFLKRNENSDEFHAKTIRTTVFLLTISFEFLIVTLPTSVVHSFMFYSTSYSLKYLTDKIAFLNHVTLFFFYLVFNVNFKITKCCDLKQSKKEIS